MVSYQLRVGYRTPPPHTNPAHPPTHTPPHHPHPTPPHQHPPHPCTPTHPHPPLFFLLLLLNIRYGEGNLIMSFPDYANKHWYRTLNEIATRNFELGDREPCIAVRFNHVWCDVRNIFPVRPRKILKLMAKPEGLIVVEGCRLCISLMTPTMISFYHSTTIKLNLS